ncbi:MAG TPA: division plane positioning ATPase MipZ, partial [Steroidobacteraceae bacterium]
KGGRKRHDPISLLAIEDPADLAVEALRSLRTSLHFATMEASNKVLMISGPSPAVGKSFVTANLAVVLAQVGQRVVVVDADMRRGHLHRYFDDDGKDGLSDVLSGQAKGIFGTKMRSVIKQANEAGIAAIVQQQFEVGRQIVAAGLVPIIEPEVDIKCPDKAGAEKLLKAGLLTHLNALKPDQLVMLKLTLPEQDNLYRECIAHPNVLRVVALSGGYSRVEANRRLAKQHDMVASFSRALVEGLTTQLSDEAFDEAMDEAIESIFEASRT